MLLHWQWNEVLFGQATEGYPKRRCQPHPFRSFTIANEKTRGRARFETLRSGAGFSPSWSSCALRSMVFLSVAMRGTREQDERERDTWSRGLRFVSTIRTGSVGLVGICDECTWTFYPTQVYLNVRCFLVTVEPYTRIVEVKSSSPSPPQHAKRAKVGSRFREEERERESTGECLRPNLFSPRFPSLALYQWTSTPIPTISTIPARSDNPS
jgi:hypothetical protein